MANASDLGWIINTTLDEIALGDVGYLVNGCFRNQGTLKQLGIPFEEKISKDAVSLEDTKDTKDNVHADAGAAAVNQASAHARLDVANEDSLLAQVDQSLEHRIDNLLEVKSQILALRRDKNPRIAWEKDWAVITSVRIGKKTAIEAKSSADSRMETGAQATMAPALMGLANASVGLSAGRGGGTTSKATSARGSVATFKAEKLKSKYWNLFGPESLEPTRSLDEKRVDAGSAFSPAGMETWRALVIGVNHYPGRWNESSPEENQLEGCVNDAAAFRRFLVERVQVDESKIHYLTSPLGADGTFVNRSPGSATAANVREAMSKLVEETQPGDHVVVFYAGHGVHWERESNPGDWYYGFAPHDYPKDAEGRSTLILDREINTFLRTLTNDKRASVTVIADTCHSGGASTRDLVNDRDRARMLPTVRLGEAEWAALAKAHPAPGGEERTRGLPENGKRAFFETDKDRDWVILSACQDDEIARESRGRLAMDADGTGNLPHGVLSLMLLKQLELEPKESVQTLRWIDFYDAVRQAVVTCKPLQRPSLGGDPVKSVFGGAWKRFDPGFNVSVVSGGVDGAPTVAVDGGVLQGLDEGAEIFIYPPNTADFGAADAGPVPPVRAVIKNATLTTCTASVLAGTPGADTPVANQSRARLAKASPKTAPMLVRAAEGVMTPAMRAAALAVSDAESFFTLVAGADKPAHVELQPWKGMVPAGVNFDEDPQNKRNKLPAWHGAQGGWVLVPSDLFGAPSTRARPPVESASESPDGAIAYLPSTPTRADEKSESEKEAALGRALGRALIHHATYLRGRGRTNDAPTLRSMLQVGLRAQGLPEEEMEDDAYERWREAHSHPVDIDLATGVCEVSSADWLHVEIKVVQAAREPLSLHLAVVAFSDEGEVRAIWPKQGEQPTLALGTVLRIGVDRFNPVRLVPRADLQRCLWTLKVIAYTADADAKPINIQSFAQETTQSVIRAQLEPGIGRGDFEGPEKPSARPAWYAWDLRVRSSRPPKSP